MKRIVQALLVASVPFLCMQCVSADMIVAAVESGGVPDYMLMHKNPVAGDLAVYTSAGRESRVQIERVIQSDLYEVSQNIGDMPYSLRLHVRGSGEIIKAELLDLKTGERKPIKMQTNAPSSVEKVRTIPFEKPTEVVTPAGSFKISQARQILFRPSGDYRSRSTSLISDDVPFLAVKTVIVSEELSREEKARLDPSHGIFTGIEDLKQKFELKAFKKN